MCFMASTTSGRKLLRWGERTTEEEAKNVEKQKNIIQIKLREGGTEMRLARREQSFTVKNRVNKGPRISISDFSGSRCIIFYSLVLSLFVCFLPFLTEWKGHQWRSNVERRRRRCLLLLFSCIFLACPLAADATAVYLADCWCFGSTLSQRGASEDTPLRRGRQLRRSPGVPTNPSRLLESNYRTFYPLRRCEDLSVVPLTSKMRLMLPRSSFRETEKNIARQIKLVIRWLRPLIDDISTQFCKDQRKLKAVTERHLRRIPNDK